MEDNDDEGGSGWGWRSSYHNGGSWFQKVTEPQAEGVELLMSGDFGRVRNRVDSQQHGNLFSRLQRTATKARAVSKEDLAHDMVPNTHGTAVACYTANVYCGQYSMGEIFRVFLVRTCLTVSYRLFTLLYLLSR
jgi:DDB1- and CUL4-associated factor 11